MQAEFPNDGLFPKRGKELNYSVNGKPRITRGELGEAAVITVNGNETDIYAPIHANDQIKVIESTAGAAAQLDINQLPEFGTTMRVEVNDKKVDLPKFACVNGNLQSGYYSIQENDNIEILNYYTVRQIAEFMDVIINQEMNIYVNNKLADMDTKVYENFSVIWTMEVLQLSDKEKYDQDVSYADLPEDDGTYVKREREEMPVGVTFGDEPTAQQIEPETEELQESGEAVTQEDVEIETKTDIPLSIHVTVNGQEIQMSGKSEYVFVDVFQYIDFDLSRPKGSGIVTNLNGREAQYMESIHSGDVIEIYWKH